MTPFSITDWLDLALTAWIAVKLFRAWAGSQRRSLQCKQAS
jgi:hypothetical protein